MATRVGPMISTLARAHGMSIGQVAAVLGVHRNRLADKIAGRLPFKESEILAAADLFGVAPGRLFDDPLELLGSTAISTSDPAWTRTSAGQPRYLQLVS